MKKRLLVTGFSGFVAGSVVCEAGDGWEVHAVSRREITAGGARLHRWTLDLRDTVRLREVFSGAKPEVVIHAAALADIDYCQLHRDEAEQTNVGVTRELVRLCSEFGAKMIFCSTDTVFDGERGMYAEGDAPQPVNFYGETKVRAEEIVRGELADGVVARLSLVFGLPVLGSGNSFLAKMSAALLEGKEVRVPENEMRTPVDVITVGRALLELTGNDFAGTLHLAGNTRINRYEMARQIARRLGYSPDLIVPTDAASMAGRAPRPVDVSLDNTMARSVLGTPMRSLDEGLDLVLKSKGN